MARTKKKNPSSCPRGKKLVKIGARKFCAKTGGKKKAGAKKKGGMSRAAWKKSYGASCRRMTVATFNKVKPLCMAAGVKAPSKKKR